MHCDHQKGVRSSNIRRANVEAISVISHSCQKVLDKLYRSPGRVTTIMEAVDINDCQTVIFFSDIAKFEEMNEWAVYAPLEVSPISEHSSRFLLHKRKLKRLQDFSGCYCQHMHD